MTGRRLTLLTRPDCHLCELAARDLSRLGIAFDTIDVDNDEGLARRYGEAIPVLLDGEVEIARAPLTLTTLRRALGRARYLEEERST